MCGENCAQAGACVHRDGSSPRVRGKLGAAFDADRVQGLIPACAGKTGWALGRNPKPRAHPRVCGENLAGSTPANCSVGSSPRVRGKPVVEVRRQKYKGLIPACAGKTTCLALVADSGWAHPRVCGENFTTVGGLPTIEGSSPRVRGKRHDYPSFGTRRRLIPACAGKTLRPSSLPSAREAHPRVCGENGIRERCEAIPGGSSPRVRGKPLIPLSPLSHTGLIPACAGKTKSWAQPPTPTKAHPRVCGENCGSDFT